MKKFTILFICLIFTITIFSESREEGNSDILIPSDGMILSTAGGIASENPMASIFFNPALISNLKMRYNVRFSYFNGLFEGTEIQDIKIGLNPLNKIYLYLSYTNFNNPNFDITDASGNILYEDKSIAGNSFIKFALSYKLKNFSAGIEFSDYGLTIVQFEDGTVKEDTQLLSVGLTYQLKKYFFGLSMMNDIVLGDGITKGAVNLMAGTRFLEDNLRLNFIFSRMTERDSYNARGGLSAEYLISNIIFLRASYFDGINLMSDGLYFGLGVRYKDIDIDYTFSFGELGTYHYISVEYGFKPLYDEEKSISKPAKKKKVKIKRIVKRKTPKTKPVPPLKKILCAVLDFEGKNMTKEDAEIITDFVRQDMINSKYFNVLERSAINQIMEEVQFQQTGCTSAECAIQIGKVLAVKKMVVGTVSRLGKKYFITVRMVDVETSQIDLATSIGIAAPIEELPSHVNKLIEKMIGSLNN